MPDVDIWEKELEKRVYNDSNPKGAQKKLNPDMADMSDDDIRSKIAEGHRYQFIGRVGRFYPIRSGKGGGLQMVLRDGKYNSVSGSKGYRWLEAEYVKSAHKEKDIDQAYHDAMAKGAIESVEKFGSFERFIDLTKPYDSPGSLDILETASVVPCGDGKYNTCMECPSCEGDVCHRGDRKSVG